MSYVQTITYDNAASLSYDSTKVLVNAFGIRLLQDGGVYPLTRPVVTTQQRIAMTSLASLTETSTVDSEAFVDYQIEINGTAYWYNSTAGNWEEADTSSFSGDYNTAATINTYAADFFADLNLLVCQYVALRIRLVTLNAAKTPILTENAIGFGWTNSNPEVINRCLIYSYLTDLLGNTDLPDSVGDMKLIVSCKQSFLHGSRFVLPFSQTASFNDSGYAEIEIIETETPGISLEFSLSFYDGRSVINVPMFNAMVPDQPTAGLNSLTTVVPYSFG